MPKQKSHMSCNKGLKMSEETKLKISQTLKGKIPWNKGLPSPWTSERNRIMNRGRIREKHPMWKGGISKIDKSIREMPEYKLWKSNCFKRDNWTCQTCHNRGYVTVHHIKSFASLLRINSIKTTIEALNCKDLWDENNGVTLCEFCHSLTDNYRGRGRQGKIVTK